MNKRLVIYLIRIKMDKNIEKIIKIFKNENKKKTNAIYNIDWYKQAILFWNLFFIEVQNNNLIYFLKEFINDDYVSILKKKQSNLFNLFNNKEWIKIFNEHCNHEESYTWEFTYINTWEVYISWLLKYYYLLDSKKSKEEKLIKWFLNEYWYSEIRPELWNLELDIIWFFLMPYNAWIKKAKILYKDSFIDNNDYYNFKNEFRKDREKDFEEYCKKEYEWPYTVKHLLFWESFIGKLK